MTRKPIQWERQEQIALFEWAKAMEGRHPELKLMFSITNSGLHHIHYAKLLNKLGRKKGVPDICLPVPRGVWHGLFIEMKPVKGGSLKPEQIDWLCSLHEVGYSCEVCKGWEAARAVILDYLEVKL